ncbi:winged helix-turn-helix domain-containing protein [Streptomyces sp. C10-9-1]|uniref:winged helix-turn-helix domain-containing protein n=1 Tax=Streptomyces sp. C10-9-1 TaxID=1859285 RepID=UPI003D74E3D0
MTHPAPRPCRAQPIEARFGQGLRPPEVARRLGLSRKSAYAWHSTWRDGGKSALSSKGSGGLPCRLSDNQAKRLQAELDAGPATHSWSEDQRWTLARMAELIHRLFGYQYTPRGVSYLLHQLGWSPQVPRAPGGRARRAGRNTVAGRSSGHG